MDADELLEKDIEAMKDEVDAAEHDLDALVEEAREREHPAADWLEAKRERRELVEDEERVEELLSHLEEAYRTAAISQDTYQRVKQANRELLG